MLMNALIKILSFHSIHFLSADCNFGTCYSFNPIPTGGNNEDKAMNFSDY